MKKNLEKIFVSASIVVAIVLIMLLLVTAFGGIEFKEFDSQLVRGLIVTLSIVYMLLSAISLVLIFIASDAVKEIVLRSKQEGSVRATIGVVRKMVKATCCSVEGVKCGKVSLITNDYGVRLKVDVKIKDKDIVETETYIRTMLEDKFLGALGFRFHAIEIKVVSLQPHYQVDMALIDQKVAVKMEEIKIEEAKLAEIIAEVEEAEEAKMEILENEIEGAIESSVDEVSADTVENDEIDSLEGLEI